mgnify:CR=1 FL=1
MEQAWIDEYEWSFLSYCRIISVFNFFLFKSSMMSKIRKSVSFAFLLTLFIYYNM